MIDANEQNFPPAMQIGTGDNELIVRLKRVQQQQWLQKRAVATGDSFASLKPIQIPLWDNESLAIQYDLTRSALFTARRNKAREDCKVKRIFSQSNLKITYTGEELRQRDYDVYLHILHIARGKEITPHSPWIHFNAYHLMKALGWSKNTKNLNELRATIRRLTACSIEISRFSSGEPKAFYGGALLHKYAGQYQDDIEESYRWQVVINTDIAAQIKPGLYTKIDWATRKELTTLGKWLHNYLSSQKLRTFTAKLGWFHQMSDSGIKNLRQFKVEIKKDLEKLRAIGFLDDYKISDGGTVTENFVSITKAAEKKRTDIET